MNSLPKLLTLAAGLAAATTGLFAQTTGTTPSTGTVPVRPTTPNGSVTLTPRPSVPPTEVQTLIRQFDAQREALLAQRRAELARLQNATAEERARILAEMQAAQAARQDEQRELARKIREELKVLREARRNGGG
ncbi:MAG: hypothetical protein JNN01_00060 [Opitutaceae bacterium]|nr:hypothetical protein [Opitutaceae bacterium]